MYAAGQPPAPLPTLLASLASSEVPGEGKVRASRVKPRPAVTHLEDLPEEFPDDLIVRNTFIDSAALLSPSLEGFYRHREVQTCPSSHAGRLLQGPLFQDPSWQPGPAPVVLGTVPCSPPPAAAPAAAAVCQPDLAVAAWPVPPPPQPPAAGGALPSAGSALHACGQCKPCGFFHGKGCDNGAACTFCHLCPPGEKRRRQKERFAPSLATAARGGGPGGAAPQKPRRASVA